WLIEPRRTNEVTKYSGTMQQVNKNTLPFLTMNAFAHFIHYWTHGQMVFVDLQGKYMFLPSTCAVADDSDGQVLFDPMVHTKNGNSCLGDLGIEGIAQFVQCHQCNHICQTLQLPLLKKSGPQGEVE
ncbi:kinase-like protein, partial [Dendrothele bispora CBS 962.96]